jgi:hypothetical protein
MCPPDVTPRQIVILVLLVACDGSSHPDDIDPQPDASPQPDSPPRAMNVVSVETFGEAPLLVMYRDGTGPWQKPVDTGQSLELIVHDRYELVAVCGDAVNGFDTGIEASTFDESGGSTSLPCFGSFDDGGQTIVASGTMTQPGTVAMGFDSDTSTTANWTFQLDVAPGLQDLVALGSGRMLIRRDLNLAAALTLPGIDVVADGAALQSVRLQLTGALIDDVVSTRITLLTGNGFFSLDSVPGTTAKVAPESLLVATDRQFLSIDAAAGPISRHAFMRYTDVSPTTIPLLPRLANIVFGPSRVTWSTVPDGDVELFTASGSIALHATATKGWLGTSTELVMDTTEVPGFLPEWRPGAIDDRRFTVSQVTGGVLLRTAIEDSPSGKPSPLRTMRRATFERRHRR